MRYVKRKELAKKFEHWRRAGTQQLAAQGSEITGSPFNVISFLDSRGILVDVDAVKTHEELAVLLLQELETGETECGSSAYKHQLLVKRIVARWRER